MARRDDRAYREYVGEEHRRQPGCPARQLCDASRFQGTRRQSRFPWARAQNVVLDADRPNGEDTANGMGDQPAFFNLGKPAPTTRTLALRIRDEGATAALDQAQLR